MAKPITKRQLMKDLLEIHGEIDAPTYVRIGRDGPLVTGDKPIKCSIKRLVAAFGGTFEPCEKNAAYMGRQLGKMIPLCGTHAYQMFGANWRKKVKIIKPRKP